MRYMILVAATLLLAACAGRDEPTGNVFDPACMPDGSVVYHQYPNGTGAYNYVQASKANCPWNRGKTQG